VAGSWIAIILILIVPLVLLGFGYRGAALFMPRNRPDPAATEKAIDELKVGTEKMCANLDRDVRRMRTNLGKHHEARNTRGSQQERSEPSPVQVPAPAASVIQNERTP
jgi:hypothetical protein